MDEGWGVVRVVEEKIEFVAFFNTREDAEAAASEAGIDCQACWLTYKDTRSYSIPKVATSNPPLAGLVSAKRTSKRAILRRLPHCCEGSAGMELVPPAPSELENPLDPSGEPSSRPGGDDVYQHPDTNRRVGTRRKGSPAWHRVGQADRRQSHRAHILLPFHVFTTDTQMIEDTPAQYQVRMQEHAEKTLSAVGQAAQAAGVACETVIGRPQSKSDDQVPWRIEPYGFPSVNDLSLKGRAVVSPVDILRNEEAARALSAGRYIPSAPGELTLHAIESHPSRRVCPVNGPQA